jgi:Holliday junction resolvasome RuvABC endonuclease subunit
MKKIQISKIENKLGKNLKRNTLVIGFDSSQHSTGISIIKTSNTNLIIEKLHLIKVSKDITKMDAIDLFIDQLDDFKTSLSGKYYFDKVPIENIYVGFNPQTGVYLARIGILVYDRFRKISKQTYLIYPSTARKLIGFKKSDKKSKGKKLKEELIGYVNKILGLKIESEDIADSIILSLSALVKLEK